MAYQIINESYGPRKPKVAIEADSLDELSGLTGFAEGSTAVVGGTEYVLDRVNGWVEPGQGGGGSGSAMVVSATYANGSYTLDITYGEAFAAVQAGKVIFFRVYAEVAQGASARYGLLIAMDKPTTGNLIAEGMAFSVDNLVLVGSGASGEKIVLQDANGNS